MKTKIIQLSASLLAITLLTACGNPKIVPASPITHTVKSEKNQENLHQMLVLLAKYKKYEILSDNGINKMRIKYSRIDRKTALPASIIYDVVNDDKSYTMSYASSENFGYKDGKLSGSYSWYINHFDDVLKKMYDNPEYLARMKVIVSNPDLHH